MSEVARNIYNQLGGHQFSAMVGAKNFTRTGSSVAFAYGSGSTFCKIKLVEDCTYTVTFFTLKRTIKVFKNIFPENLLFVFSAHTGLDVSL